MKKRLCSIFAVILALITVFSAVPVGAAEPAPAQPSLAIHAKNLSFQNEVQLVFAVSYENIPLSDVKLLVWTTPHATYEYGTQTKILSTNISDTVEEKTCAVFYYTDLAARQMTDVIYVRAYAEAQGVGYYSEVTSYSILTYAYNKLGKTDTASSDSRLKTLLTDMLTYGASAQRYIGYTGNGLADADFYQIKVEGGTLADGCTEGLYLPQKQVTITAPATNEEGEAFHHWRTPIYEHVSDDRTVTVTVGTENARYIAAYGDFHIDAQWLQYYTLKEQYLETNAAYYSVDNLSALSALFENAYTALQNCTTVEAAEKIVDDLTVAAAAVESLADLVENLEQNIKALYVEFEDGRDYDRIFSYSTDHAKLVEESYDLYQTITEANGGNLSFDTIAVDWEYLTDGNGDVIRWTEGMAQDHPSGIDYLEGERVLDVTKPTAWYTVEEFYEGYLLSYVFYVLEELVESGYLEIRSRLSEGYAIDDKTLYGAVYAQIPSDDREVLCVFDVVSESDVWYELFHDADYMIEDFLSNECDIFSETAPLPIETIYSRTYHHMAELYVKAANTLIDLSKDYALEHWQDVIYEEIDRLEDDMTEGNQAAIEAQIELLLAEYQELEARIQSAPIDHTLESLNSEEMREAYGVENDLENYIGTDGIDEVFFDYLADVVVNIVEEHMTREKVQEPVPA